MFDVRRVRMADLPQMQQINLECLAENYQLKYWEMHMMQWPEATYVATVGGRVVGYIMGKVEENHGHITSVAVLGQYRGLGIATRLLRLVHIAMRDYYRVAHCTLHVRVTNEVAKKLYRVNNAYYEQEVDTAYFADGEDAYKMTCRFENIDGHGVPIPEKAPAE